MMRQTDISKEAFQRARDVHGAKLVIFFGEEMPVILRDDRPDIAEPGMFDFPGGGREAGESAVDCVLRETEEELSLRLSAADLHYGRLYHDHMGREVWFFAAHLGAERRAEIALGDEGQFWQMMRIDDYLTDPRAIVRLQSRLAEYLAG
ncbi:NUDIX domain-containing protein [Pseudooceanicola spongiae]|uniref:NUDIX domain-containing protein n=1 Tax=Pseudooceanicola spongiae TaxID=2613965 RepID=A0A7L9WNZ6_9RHOB|nr:NUDIX hydrolase [Pseudooceanicola spongiae]QOL81673.1 NUDIX domain-containing protein [Pseudooceanicola spongiae]